MSESNPLRQLDPHDLILGSITTCRLRRDTRHQKERVRLVGNTHEFARRERLLKRSLSPVLQCHRSTEKKPDLCVSDGHPIRFCTKLVKRFWACTACKERTDTVGREYPDVQCRKCGGEHFKPTGMRYAVSESANKECLGRPVRKFTRCRADIKRCSKVRDNCRERTCGGGSILRIL